MRTTSAVAIGIVGLSAMIAIAADGQIKLATPSSEARSQILGDAEGNLRVPDGYRTAYQYLGSWAVAADQGKGSKELHAVYASPGTIEAYRKDGHFPDNTVLVKEVYEAATGQLTTGTVSRADTLKGWFVMVKDNDDHHPGNKLWGDGWGWSWFDAADPSKTTSTDYRLNCKTCHVPAQSSDWVYIDGYPALKR